MPGLADPDKAGTVTIRMHARDVVAGGHGEVNTGRKTADHPAPRLLTLRENHRLTGIPPRPFEPAV